MRIITLCAGLLLGTAIGASAQSTPAARPQARWQHFLHAQKPAAPASAAAQLRVSSGRVLPGRAMHHGWSSTSNSWVKGTVETYAYDAQGRLTQESFTDSATNVPQERSLYTYDSRGLGTEELYQEWDGAAWANVARYVATYDAQRNLTEGLYQEWTGTAWATDGGSRFTLTYNAAGVLTEQLEQQWENGGFVNYERLQYTVSAANQWTAISQQLWDQGQWENEARFSNLVWRDWSKQQLASYEEQDWVGQWSTVRRGTLVYTANDGYTLTEESAVGSGWENYSREVVTNDAQGNQTSDESFNWQAGAWNLNFGYRSLLRYSANGELLRRLDQEFNPMRSTAYVNSDLYLYSNFTTLATQPRAERRLAAEAYPNPTTGTLTLRWPGAARSGEVLNALGQPVQALQLPGAVTSCVLDLKALPAGVYTVRLRTADGVATQRVVKQ